MRPSYLLLAALCGAASASHVPGLYGLTAQGSLIRLLPNASSTTLSPPQPFAQAQQLSCVDAPRGIFYFIGYANAQPALVGLSLETGATLSTTPLPELYDQTYVGIGQYVAIEPASARVFVGGQDSARNHIVGLVDPASGAFEMLANLSSSLRDVFGGTSAYTPATNELWFELDLDIMVLNLATKKVDVLPVSEAFGILGMNLAPSGLVYGLGGGPGEGVRTVVALDPRARSITPVGSVPDYAMQAGGITAYDSSTGGIFWLAQKTGAPASAPWFLVQNSVEGGGVMSSAPICADSSAA